MLSDVLDMPAQIHDAIWRVDTANLKAVSAKGLVVAGMGGSATGGDLARGMVLHRLNGPLVVSREYGLPGWVDSGWVVLASSYSGNTEETISAFEVATEVEAMRIVAGTGGKLGELARAADVDVVGMPGFFQPRAAVAYMAVTAGLVAHKVGIGPDIRDELERAAAHLEGERDGMLEQAREVASAIGTSPMVIHGAGLTGPVARRWATQFNENAKQFAFAAMIPEANHNLTEAWEHGQGGLGAIFLRDAGQSDRERLRIELSAELVERSGAPSFVVDTQGTAPAERLFWSVMFGDLVSVLIAEQRGLDPLPVEGIEMLKRRLTEA